MGTFVIPLPFSMEKVVSTKRCKKGGNEKYCPFRQIVLIKDVRIVTALILSQAGILVYE
jgi:hypothetical protein